MNKQAIRMAIHGSMAAFVALAAMPAAAVPGVTAVAFNQFTPEGEDRRVLESIQTLNPPTPGPASVSARQPTGWTFSVANYGPEGLQRYYASANLDVLGNQQSTAGGGFEDKIVMRTGAPGERGVATFAMRLTGALFASVFSPFGSADARTSFQWYNPDVAGSFENWMAVATPGSEATVILDTLIFKRNYVVGEEMILSANWRANAAVFLWEVGSGIAYADLSKTGRWLGLQSAVTSDGRDVTSTMVITSESGYDYARAVPISVPEPGSLALLSLGLAGLGLSRRRKAN